MGDALSEDLPAVFLKTTDGGDNWILVNQNTFGGWASHMWRDIDFVNPLVGYFCAYGVNPRKLYKIID
ncbi:MAG: hypothetical protein Kow0098_22530 [Ignavibacteriaceae bacterium]